MWPRGAPEPHASQAEQKSRLHGPAFRRRFLPACLPPFPRFPPALPFSPSLGIFAIAQTVDYCDPEFCSTGDLCGTHIQKGLDVIICLLNSHAMDLLTTPLAVTWAGSVLGLLSLPAPSPSMPPSSAGPGAQASFLMWSLAWRFPPGFQEFRDLLPLILHQPDILPHPGVPREPPPRPQR